MKTTKSYHCLDSYIKLTEGLDSHWFEWSGRLVLDRREVDRFEKQTIVLIKTIRALSINRRRYHHIPNPGRQAGSGGQNSCHLGSLYPPDAHRCSCCD